MKFTQEALDKIDYFKKYINSLFDYDLTINDERLLLEAFIHKSYACDYVGNYAHNERLEFLGDGILGAVINKKLFLTFQNEPESKLTLYKVNLVRESTLAEVAKDIGLGNYIMIGNGEQKQGGYKKASILSDGVEAIIGFLYIDQQIDVVEDFITRYVFCKIDNIKNKQNKSFKSQIQEFIQKKIHKIPEYKTTEYEYDQNKNVIIYKSILEFEGIEGVGYGKNKKMAEENSAKDLLNKINEGS